MGLHALKAGQPDAEHFPRNRRIVKQKEAQSCTATLAARPSLRTAAFAPTAATWWGFRHAEETDALPRREKDCGRLCRASSVFRSRRIACAHPLLLHRARYRSISGRRHVPARMDHRSRGATTETGGRCTTASDELGIWRGFPNP